MKCVPVHGDRRTTAAPIVVRPLIAADRMTWGSLWEDYCRFYRIGLSSDVTDASFAALCRGESMRGLTCLDETGTPAGFAHLVFHPSTWSRAPYCYLEDLYLAPRLRGGAATRILFDAVYAEADRRDAARVYWHTQEYNAPARSLYDCVGHRTSFIVYRRR